MRSVKTTRTTKGEALPRTPARKAAAPKEARAGRASERANAPTAFLHAHGISVTPETMERMVAAAVEDLPRTLYPAAPHHDLTEAEQEALVRGGLDLAPRELGERDPLARTVADYAALLRRSRTVAETARLLGVNESRVRQRLGSKPPTLYGWKLEGEWRIPDFLFERRRLIPGVSEVASRLDPAIHPVGFFRWFTMPDPDLATDGDRGNPLSPRLWLLSGHSPETVAELAAGL